MTFRVPRPAPVKSQMGRPLTHKFNKCGHTVEKDKCIPPPKKLMQKAKMPSSSDNLVVWDLWCMDCDWRKTVEKAVCENMKEQILAMERMRVQNDKGGNVRVLVKRGECQADKRGNVILFIHHERSTDEHGKEIWKPYRVIVRAPRSLDGSMSHNWKAYLADVRKHDTSLWLYGEVCSLELETKEILGAFEQKWNEDGDEDSPAPSAKASSVGFFDPDKPDGLEDELNEIIQLIADFPDPPEEVLDAPGQFD